jgi:uncharacterized protein (DUF1330 family)
MSDSSHKAANNPTVAELLSFYGEGDKYPSAEQWRSLLASEHQGKVVMVNLIKLADMADNPYQPGEQLSGLELMTHYQAVSAAAVERVGGRAIYQGLIAQAVIGAGNWDVVALVEYPSIDAFIQLFQDPLYREGHLSRAAACSDHQLLLSIPL